MSSAAHYLGFDFGTRWIGVAVGQTITQTAQPLPALKVKAGIPDWQEIAGLVVNWQPAGFVVGLPLTVNGESLPVTAKAQEFGASLESHFHLPIFFHDERHTSVEARQQLFAKGGYRALKKEAVDSLAAKLILESWLANEHGMI